MPDLVHRRLRAPQEDGAALIAPPLSEAHDLIQFNRTVQAEFDRHLGSRASLRQFGRTCLLESTVRFETEKAIPVDRGQPLILSGHQPELFHPGVWLKNFVISELARSVDGLAINLVIDNDVVHSTGIGVPTANNASPAVATVPFDRPEGGIPWEEQPLVDRELFRSFPQRVYEAIEPWYGGSRGHLIVDALWPLAEQAIDAEHGQRQELFREMMRRIQPPPGFSAPSLDRMINLGRSLSVARHRLEQKLGLEKREVELSDLCWMPCYFDFVSLFFDRVEEFHGVYNAALHEYRHVNHIRSRSHPVPDLAREGEWFEMPFWIWSEADPRRRHAFIRRVGPRWELCDGHQLRLTEEECRKSRNYMLGGPCGIKLRPRALITTMYARLVLSDLFIHGIGGAKYDELTDLIIRRFFGIEPPKYVTATATFRLPIDRPQATADDVRDAARKLRDPRYHPESLLRDRLVANDASLREPLSALAAEKREYLAQHDLRRCEQEVFQRLDTINRAMHQLLRPVEEHLRAEHAELTRQLKQSQMLGSREFSFVLFPAEKLSARLLDLCKSSP